jgi:hypothetical protein
MEQKLPIMVDPSPTLPFVRGGSFCMSRDLISSGLGPWRKVAIIAVLPSPNEGEGLGVRSAMQVNFFKQPLFPEGLTLNHS